VKAEVSAATEDGMMKINFTTALTAAALFAIPLTVTACDQKTTETKKETTTTTTAPAATPAPVPDTSTTTTTTTEKKE
jgi:hypothetical protein